jgi:hypothetical protein
VVKLHLLTDGRWDYDITRMHFYWVETFSTHLLGTARRWSGQSDTQKRSGIVAGQTAGRYKKANDEACKGHAKAAEEEQGRTRGRLQVLLQGPARHTKQAKEHRLTLTTSLFTGPGGQQEGTSDR